MMRNTPRIKRVGFLDDNVRRRIVSIYILFLLIVSVISSVIPVISADQPESILLAKEAKDTTKEDSGSAVESTPAADVVADTPAADDSEDDSSSAVESTPAADVVADTPAASDSSDDSGSSEESTSAADDEDDSSSAVKSNPAADVVADTPAADVAIKIVSSSEKDLGEISEGVEIEVEPDNKQETSIYAVSFTPSANLNQVTLSVSSYNGKPEEVEDIPDVTPENQSVYKYLDIKLTSNNTYVGETGIETMTFTFTIEKTWINENNIDKTTVEMLRFHDGAWQHLSTTLLSENDTSIVYEAETPGLSTFAVVGNRVVESSVSTINEVPKIPWFFYAGIIIVSVCLLVVFLFKARVIYFDNSDHKTEKTTLTNNTSADNTQHPQTDETRR